MAIWELRDLSARLVAPQLSAVIDLARPDPHLAIESLAGGDFPNCRVLGVELPDIVRAAAAQPSDVYTRNQDLVVTYAPPTEDPVRLQIYWTFHAAVEPTGTAFGIDLAVSIQTSRLEFDPTVTTFSELPPGELYRVTDAGAALPWQESNGADQDRDSSCLPAALMRPDDAHVSYLEMPWPRDWQQMSVYRSALLARIAHRLFCDSLEKGVILRAQVRAAFLPRKADAELARQTYDAFAATAPPLTT